MTQIDFLDELGRELDRAAGLLIGEGRRTRRRAVLAPLAALAALAAVAAVAVAVWPSAPADPEREVAASPQLESLKQMLGVLRRPETEADAGPVAAEGREALAEVISGETIFRLVDTTASGEGVVLAAAETVTFPGPGTGKAGACLYYPGVDGGVGCWTAEAIAGASAYHGVGDDLHGLAPDGAVRATVSIQDDDLDAPVHDNYFSLVREYDRADEIVAVTLRDEQGRAMAQYLGARAEERPAAVPEATQDKARALAGRPEPERTGHPVGSTPGEVRAVANDLAGGIPYPPGVRDDFTAPWVPGDPGRAPSIHERFDVQRLLELRAQCIWLRYWLSAVQAGAEQVASAAARVIETTPRWPTMRSDPRVESIVADVRRLPPPAVGRHFASNCGAGVAPAPTPGP